MSGLKRGEHRDMEMPFGCYGLENGRPGRLICDLPDWYLIWLLDQEFVYKRYPEVVRQLEIEDKYRKDFVRKGRG